MYYRQSKQRAYKLVTRKLKYKTKPYLAEYRTIYIQTAQYYWDLSHRKILKLFLKLNADMLEECITQTTYRWWKADEKF